MVHVDFSFLKVIIIQSENFSVILILNVDQSYLCCTSLESSYVELSFTSTLWLCTALSRKFTCPTQAVDYFSSNLWLEISIIAQLISQSKVAFVQKQILKFKQH